MHIGPVGKLAALPLSMAALLLIQSAVPLFPQATTNEIYTYSALAGDPAYKYATVRLDPSLELARDPQGVVHMMVANQVMLNVGVTPLVSATGWTLAPIPTGPVACYRNGLRQSAADYAIAGNAITSASWQPGDTLVCDFASAN